MVNGRLVRKIVSQARKRQHVSRVLITRQKTFDTDRFWQSPEPESSVKKPAFVASPAIPWPLPRRPMSVKCANRADFDPTGASLSDCFALTTDPHPLQNLYHRTAPSRMVRFQRPYHEILIYVDGSCLDQNRNVDMETRRAGCAVVHGTQRPPQNPKMHYRAFMFPLEGLGPTGEYHHPTGNRAELRAATAALGCWEWSGEGWRIVTIATDSTYVVDGITDWMVRWQERDRTKFNAKDVANRDLWERLVQLVNEHARNSVDVRFMHIPRHLNGDADEFAKGAAARSNRHSHYKTCDLTDIENQHW